MIEEKQTYSDSHKKDIQTYWNAEPCGTRQIDTGDRRRFFDEIERARYRRGKSGAHIPGFAKFERAKGKRLLEIGVGAGTDFVNWVRAGAVATGIDLTEKGVEITKERLALEGLQADVKQGDAENLPFEDATFDIVYSYGVLMVTPDTPKAIREVHRVLKPGGKVLLLLYRLPSWTAFNMWILHCLGKGQPWKSPRWAAYHYLESPGTKLYTDEEVRWLMHQFEDVHFQRDFLNGDTLMMPPSKKYHGFFYRVIWRLYPRWLVRLLGTRFGLGLLVEARKPEHLPSEGK